MPALHAVSFQQPVLRRPAKYSLRRRALIIVGSASGLWALVALAGWFLYRMT